jgi:vanillate O-demethylase ferredoxin subunit
VDVHLPFVREGLSRPYSLCSDPAELNGYRIAVLREPHSRGGSAAMHDAVHEGMTLQISPPRNAFALSAAAHSHLLLGGGIGITPLLAMAQVLHRQGATFELHLAARTRARAAFAGLLASSPWSGHAALHLDDGPPVQRLDLPRLLADPAPGRHLYVCGPAGFVDAVLDTAKRQGWTEDRMHTESFSPAAAQAEDGSFEVEIAGTGRVIPVAAQQTVLQALAAAGIELPSSCEQGVCGTCLTRVVAGVPDHRDQYLLPEEQAANDQFLPCCSRARTPRLVIAL